MRKTVIVYGDEPERYGYPCCGEKTLFIREEYDICSNCGWEDDGSDQEAGEWIDKIAASVRATTAQVLTALSEGNTVEEVFNKLYEADVIYL